MSDKTGIEMLRELAEDMESVDVSNIGTDYARGYEFACGYAAALVRKAIEGAPVDLATAAGNLVAQCRPCRERREAAADWVKAHGGLDAVRDRMAALDDFISDVAEKVGVPIDEKGPMTIYGDVIEELDKRLMPLGTGWPHDTEGNKVDFGEEIADNTDDHDARAIDSIKFVGGIAYLFDRYGDMIATVDTSVGERVKRPQPEVLGADGKPILKGDTVWFSESGAKHADSTCTHGLCPDDELTVLETGFAHVCSVAVFKAGGPSGYVEPEWVTHTPPDAQERIDEDKHKSMSSYWDCYSCDCSNCPSLINDKTPNKHYGVVSCSIAMGMDIARHEQELKARTGGAE